MLRQGASLLLGNGGSSKSSALKRDLANLKTGLNKTFHEFTVQHEDGDHYHLRGRTVKKQDVQKQPEP